MDSLLALEKQLELSPRVWDFVKAAIVGCAEMAGYLSRWDRWYLKSYEAMAGHRFNLTTLASEPNVIGAGPFGRGSLTRRLAALVGAAEWLHGRTGRTLKVDGPVGSNHPRQLTPGNYDARIVVGSSGRTLLPSKTVRVVLTDPPYENDVSYHELSALFSAWARRANWRGSSSGPVRHTKVSSTGHGDYRATLRAVFAEAKRVLAADGRLVFTFANRDPGVWITLMGALKETGFDVVGYSIVRAENEMDQGKRGVRACRMNLIVDAVPERSPNAAKWRPRTPRRAEAERRFLAMVGDLLLNLRSLGDGWEEEVLAVLKGSKFLIN